MMRSSRRVLSSGVSGYVANRPLVYVHCMSMTLPKKKPSMQSYVPSKQNPPHTQNLAKSKIENTNPFLQRHARRSNR